MASGGKNVALLLNEQASHSAVMTKDSSAYFTLANQTSNFSPAYKGGKMMRLHHFQPSAFVRTFAVENEPKNRK